MIQRSTVLVLGAGASNPYGLPTANELVRKACEEIEEHSNGPILPKLESLAGIPRRDARAFFSRLRDSGQPSIDAFLQRQRKESTQLRHIGKATMVAQLVARESDELLRGASDADDWYKHLFARMTPPDPGAFRNHQLSIITFNFDRSLERRLFLLLKATYDIDDEYAATLTEQIDILHVHGMLGGRTWLGEKGRPYEPVANQPDFLACVNQIAVIDDEIPDDTIARAKKMLNQAVRVCFLGFSFHEDNLRRLDAAATLKDKIISGTCHGMSEAAQDRVYNYFNFPNRSFLQRRSVRDFFNVVDFFDN